MTTAANATRGPLAILRGKSIPYFMPALAAVFVMVVITGARNPAFYDGGWKQVLVYASPLILLAMAQTPVVLAGGGGLDLSIGPAAGLTSVLLVVELIPRGISVWWAICTAALMLGAASGAVNGALSALVRIPPMIATLATYLVFTGLASQLLSSPAGSIPSWFTWFTKTGGPLPNITYVIIAVGLLWSVLCRTAYWRNLRAVGSNDRAAFTAGVPIARVRFTAYVLAGLMTGIGGIVLTAVLGGADSTVGPTYTLQAIAAVALGGVSLAGGRGGLIGAVCGAALLFLIQNYLTLLEVSSFVLQMIYGIVLIIAVVSNGIWDKRRRVR
jgi:ribose transport system permease protein